MKTMSDRIDKCLSKVGNRFMLATVVSRRWEQLVTGGRPMVPSRDPRSIEIVLREVEEEKLKLNSDTMTIERLGEPVEPELPLEGTAGGPLITADEETEAAAEEASGDEEE
jgi:DNA-directed RNA polymerase omega subunit